MHFDTVQDLYIAYYQRPGDPSGMRYWSDSLDAGTDLLKLEAAFGTSPESMALYGSINESTIGTVIDSIYLALFDRLPDAAGKAYYIAGFKAGTFTPASIAYNILVGAQNEDALAVDNKELAADRFSEAVDGRPLDNPAFGQGRLAATYAGDADAESARGWLCATDAETSSIPSSADTVAFIKSDIANPGDPILGGTLTEQVKAAAVAAGYKTCVFHEWDWVNGELIVRTFDDPQGPIGKNGIVVIAFTPTAKPSNAVGSFSTTPYPGTAQQVVRRTASLSTRACDFTPPLPYTRTDDNVSLKFTVGSYMPDLYAPLVAGQLCFYNVESEDTPGIEDMLIHANAPSG